MRSRVKVKVGSVSVPVYPIANGRWCIVYRTAKRGARHRVTRASLAEAKLTAEQICLDIARGQLACQRLNTDQLLQAASALQIIEPMKMTLDGVARDIRTAVGMVGDASIVELARFWAKHHPFGREEEAA